MGIAGVSWGIYSLRGRGMANPLAQTTINFVRAVPLVIIVSIVAAQQLHVSPRGILLAVVSGALTSGLGYMVWYARHCVASQRHAPQSCSWWCRCSLRLEASSF